MYTGLTGTALKYFARIILDTFCQNTGNAAVLVQQFAPLETLSPGDRHDFIEDCNSIMSDYYIFVLVEAKT